MMELRQRAIQKTFAQEAISDNAKPFNVAISLATGCALAKVTASKASSMQAETNNCSHKHRSAAMRQPLQETDLHVQQAAGALE